MKKKMNGFLWFSVLCTMVLGFVVGCEVEDKVYDGDYWIGSRVQVRRLSGYSEVTGNVVIMGSLTNVDGLESLTTIGGKLRITSNDRLTNLDGLTNLASVGSLFISDNTKLASLDGLGHLTGVEESIYIGGNVLIENVDFLQGISPTQTISIDIAGNDALENISGINHMVSAGILKIRRNPLLENIDLSQLASCSSLSISKSEALKYISGFASLISIEGTLNISENPVLEKITGMANLTSIGRKLTITENPALEEITGLTNLTSIAESLTIKSNVVLENITGLSNLTSIGINMMDSVSITVTYNSALTTLSAFEHVAFVDGDLFIFCNNRAMDFESDQFKDRLIEEGWDGCWDFTCDGIKNRICQ